MSVYSDIVKRSYFDGSTGKALQNFADQSGRSALDMDCVRPNTIESCPPQELHQMLDELEASRSSQKRA
jgi:hypothetical protein